MTSISLPGLPAPLIAEGPPSAPPVLSGASVRLSARAGADLFLDPSGAAERPDAERFVMPVRGDFRFSARVSVQFDARYDSGVVLGYVDDSTWFKICAELDDAGAPSIVSVVTRDGASDDCNHWLMQGQSAYLRIARTGRTFACHASEDGVRWRLARYFSLGVAETSPVKLGLLAQSPVGEGTTATFDDVRFADVGLNHLRDGS